MMCMLSPPPEGELLKTWARPPAAPPVSGIALSAFVAAVDPPRVGTAGPMAGK